MEHLLAGEQVLIAERLEHRRKRPHLRQRHPDAQKRRQAQRERGILPLRQLLQREVHERDQQAQQQIVRQEVPRLARHGQQALEDNLPK